MNREYLSDALGGIADRHIRAGYEKKTGGRRILWQAAAAVLALVLLAGAAGLLLTPKGAAVYAYAAGTDTELTGAGQSFTTGSISDEGELTGHPLMFYLTGEGIDTVRFSVKNQLINFVDLTEQRDEFGFAQNFTVPYGERESEYSFLVIDWNPRNIIDDLRSGKYASVRDIPAEERSDIIVMEIAMANGTKAVKAVTVELRDDGSFFAVFDDYKITENDDYVNRPDAPAVPREDLYYNGEVTVQFLDWNGEELAPEGGWYQVENIGYIRVSWEGREPDLVQMYAMPTGTGMIEYMKLLATIDVNTAENAVTFGSECLREVDLDHVWFKVTFNSDLVGVDSTTISSDTFNMIRTESDNDGENEAHESVDVRVLDFNGDPLEPEAGWYDASQIGSVEVTWHSFMEAMTVQAFTTPTGTEMAEYTRLLATIPVTEGNTATFGPECFRDLTMDHVWFEVTFDHRHMLTTTELNVFGPME